MFDHIVRTDHQLLLLNTFHLMFIVFLPFSTSVLAESLHDRVDQSVATAFYGGTLTVIGILVSIMWYYAAHEHWLLGERISRDEAKRYGRGFLLGTCGYAIATLVAMIVPWLALAFFVAINVFFLWPRRISISGQ